VIELDSRQVEAHPKIKSFPFRGAHRFQFTIRPPQLADSTKFRLVVSFQFTVRSGCHIRVTSPTVDAINVVVSVTENEYKQRRRVSLNVYFLVYRADFPKVA